MAEFDVVIRGGTIYDGTGDLPYRGDIGIIGDMIAGMGVPGELRGAQIIDADGLAVAPGFINMLSWANESLIADGHSQSNIRQGVTLEVLGEGESMGPLNDAMKKDYRGILTHADIHFDVEWTTLAEYLEYLEKRGVSPNVASFVGAGTLRIHEMGYENRPATQEEMDAMKRLLRHEMEAGAMGMSAALIYPPETYISTDELIELCEVVQEYDGLYISHIRNEGSAIHAALDEFFKINEVSGVRSEIYHLKVAGQRNWHHLQSVIERIQEKRAEGYAISADMYPYNASGTGLSSCIPSWAHEGGHHKLMERLRDDETRRKIRAQMLQPSDAWENMFADNPPENIFLAGFKEDHLREKYQGKRLSDVAAEHGSPAVDVLIDLILEDNSRIFTIYFTMNEDNVRKKVQLPFVSFCSDAGSFAPEEPFISRHAHPRAYGSFARVLGHYSRDEGLLPLEEAVRRMTALPAENLKIDHERGLLQSGYFADIAIFDPATIIDNATFVEPHQYATGMQHVFVNGVQVLRYGDHTGATPGQFVRGPGYQEGY